METNLKKTEIGRIPEDWQIQKLKELCIKITDGSHFSPKTKIDGKYIATVKDMLENGFNYSTCRKISEEDFQKLELQDCKPLEGDVLIAKDGSYLKHVFVSNGKDEIVVLSSIAILRPNKEKINPLFLKYLFKDPITKERVKGNYVSGAVIPRIILRDFEKISLPLPSIEEQITIAKILSSLDEKIELNNKINKNLEAVGQALFKKWFIDEAKEEWERKPLDEIAEFLNGLALQKYPSKEGEKFLPAIKIKELRNGVTDQTDKVDFNLPKKYIIEDGDVLFSWSGTLEVVIWTNGSGALNQHLFKVSSSKYPKWFYYFWVKNYLPEFRNIAEDKATTMGHIQRQHLTESEVSIPDRISFEKMDKVMTPLIQKFVNLKLEAQKLSKIRDSLLPKLMSGEIRLK
jgi:type I restriction enzyme S subunit